MKAQTHLKYGLITLIFGSALLFMNMLLHNIAISWIGYISSSTLILMGAYDICQWNKKTKK